MPQLTAKQIQQKINVLKTEIASPVEKVVTENLFDLFGDLVLSVSRLADAVERINIRHGG
jgi:hypothetical protein